MLQCIINHTGTAEQVECLHFAELVDFLFLGHWIDLDDSNWCADAKSTIKDIDTKDDRITFTESGDNLQSAWPNCLRGGITSLCLCDFSIVRREGIEEMVDNISL